MTAAYAGRDGRAAFDTYLHRVSRHLAVDFLRHRPRVVFAGEDEILDVPDVETGTR